jgi:dihydroflavonol-4-reductase
MDLAGNISFLMRVLVTGANGFIGSALVRRLLADGFSVRALVRAGSNRENLKNLDLDCVEGDLRDRRSLERALEHCRAVFHVAADYRLWVPDAERMYDINVRGTERLFHAALAQGIQRIVYTSSVATIGIPENGLPGDETTPVSIHEMVGHYKRSKFQAEELVCGMVEKLGAPIVIVNPSTPLGPGDIKPTPTGQIVLDAMRGRMPAYVDTGLNIVHVHDVAAGHLLAFHHGRVGERYILGGENISLQSLLTQIAGLAGKKPPRLRLPHGFAMGTALIAEGWARVTRQAPRITMDGVRMSRKRMYYSSRKASDELGYSPQAANLAVRDSIRWFRKGHAVSSRRRGPALSAGGRVLR